MPITRQHHIDKQIKSKKILKQRKDKTTKNWSYDGNPIHNNFVAVNSNKSDIK